MAKQDVNPDALASKTFVVTILGAILYITVVFVFVIQGNRRDEEAEQIKGKDAIQQAAQGVAP